MRIYRFQDPERMIGSGLLPEAVFGNAQPIAGTVGQEYAQRRGVPVTVAAAAGGRFGRDLAVETHAELRRGVSL